MNIRVLNAAEVRAALPMADAIAGMKTAYRELSLGRADVPLRSRIDIPEHSATALFMPAYLAQSGSLAVKIVNIFPENIRRALPTLHALVVVLDAATGQPVALLEGSALTAIRTGAGSGAATDLLARQECRVAAVFGTGEQARTQLEAICTARRLERVWVVGRNAERAVAFAEQVAGEGPVPRDVQVAVTPAQALREADIICTATTSAIPVFAGEDVRAGTHINAVGGYTPAMQEVDATTVLRSKVYVDSRAAVLAEAGDLLEPIRLGQITPAHILGEIGELVAGRMPGRQSAEDITLFKSVGVAVQDAVAAQLALERATSLGLGSILSL